MKLIEHVSRSCGFGCSGSSLKLNDFLTLNVSENCVRMDQAASDGGKIVLSEQLLCTFYCDNQSVHSLLYE